MALDRRTHLAACSVLLPLLWLVAACSEGSGGPADSGVDAGLDAGADGGEDGGLDGGEDGGGDADAGGPVVLDLVQYVDPFIGTDDSSSPHPVPGGAGGSAYPGPSAPFGMVQFSPDTPTASPSGYRYSDLYINQFSLTHLDGAGCPNDEDIPIMPVVGELDPSPGTRWSNYRSGYAKSSQEASPGYYRVLLGHHGILAELTATTRAGFARFTYPASDTARVLVHTGRSATGMRDGTLEIVGSDRIQGTVLAGGFCGSDTSFTIHFVMLFDRAFTDCGTWLGDTVSPGSNSESGSPSGGYATFDTSAEPVVQVKVGLSYVSIANAAANLEAEIPGWDFDAVREAAAAEWNAVLNRIQVDRGREEDLRKFYTALYRVFQNPNTASDVNGEYMGFDGAVHSADRVTYQNFSGWDIIRSWTHLVSALAPEAPDIFASMVQDGVERGLLPFWSHQNVETHVMVGDPGTVNVANAHAMGVRGFDAEAALALMKRSADEPLHTNRWALQDWIDLHFVGNAAVSLEYAMADFALAQYAQALGDAEACEKYLARSAYWQESWNPADGYIEPRVGGTGAYAARIYEFEVFGPDDPETNLALGGSATASAACNASEGPDKAINGTWTGGTSDKWCDNTSQDKWWQVDLGSVQRVDRFVVHHAGAGGEATAWNTQDYDISISVDGSAFTTAVEVRGNSDSAATHAIEEADARFVRLDILTAIQGGAPGAWDCQPFDPAAECGYIEGNGAQYVWLVPQDMEGLFTLMGGHEQAAVRLDDLFTELNAGTNRPYFYIGNEPEHGTPWTYHFAGAPGKTQAVVRRIVEEEFHTDPGGLPGNDDLGSTSAWLVWAYLGLYPVIPGTDVLVIHGPAFRSAELKLADGRRLAIRGQGAGSNAPYIQSLQIDGTPTTRSWLRFGELSEAASLDFVMGSSPNADWGSGEADLPPSFGP
ncbi:MAG: GH92 family glycosyl hydrolase [Deltaproteobacteria bacterium]|nr:GH92 family glycosyl hydrolase [Deltaproteobacteria bacterium]